MMTAALVVVALAASIVTSPIWFMADAVSLYGSDSFADRISGSTDGAG